LSLPDQGLAEPGPFAEPWQANAFALVVALQQSGTINWTEWAATLSAVVKAHPDADGDDYYHLWLEALETLLIRAGMTDAAAVEHLATAWSRAAEATPHGQPIRLDNDPLGG
jgi:nitrile hydratase accessory protein